ncbi:MAG: 4-hydroxy-tetrahydrodipicolinate synthase [Magnetovibrio sp.]|nr:4-hydroxy-tetrahydrodipicolinate synthase [Magnetovibrio sp.]
MFKGSFVALVTPFTNGEINDDEYQSFVDWQVNEGTHGLVPCGTTGESPTMSHGEHKHVTELCIEAAAGRVPVVAGAGSNSTAEAVDLATHAEATGADAILVVSPYYNKPTQAGLFAHYEAINNAVGLPIIVYNIPGRSIVNIDIGTMKKISALSNVVGVKDATADLSLPAQVRREIGADFCQLSGEDATVIPFLAAGGHGCISVTANVAPALCAEQHNAWNRGDVAGAQAVQDKLVNLHQAMFCESSPGPAIYAVKLLGFCSDEMRLPLVGISDASKAQVEAAVFELGLLG